ncbi:MAG TPA: hypothetical protein VGM56_10960 [Byssovorax sp.]|jgi:hypothetical protein
MTEPQTPEYGRFLASVKGVDPDDREHLDVGALKALKGDEKDAAHELLVERVKTTDDWRGPPAIAEIRLKRAVGPMRARLPRSKGRMRVALASALVELGAIDSIDDTVVDMLKGGDGDEGITALAAADGRPPTTPLMKGLAWSALHHPSGEVRANAGAAILRMAKLGDDPLMWAYRPLYIKLAEDDEAVRRDAYLEICKLTQMPPSMAD